MERSICKLFTFTEVNNAFPFSEEDQLIMAVPPPSGSTTACHYRCLNTYTPTTHSNVFSSQRGHDCCTHTHTHTQPSPSHTALDGQNTLLSLSLIISEFCCFVGNEKNIYFLLQVLYCMVSK